MAPYGTVLSIVLPGGRTEMFQNSISWAANNTRWILTAALVGLIFVLVGELVLDVVEAGMVECGASCEVRN